MKIKNRGYVLPVALGALIVASLGLLSFSWFGLSKKIDNKANVNTPKTSIKAPVNDNAALEADSLEIDAMIKALDESSLDINSSLTDSSLI